MERPRKYSYWQLFSMYEKCPYAYNLGYEQRVRSKPPDGVFLGKQLLGSAFHYSQEYRVKKAIPWEVVCKPELIDFWLKCGCKSIENQGIEITTRRRNKVRTELDRVLHATMEGEHRAILDAVTYAEVPFKAEVELGPDKIRVLLGGRPDARGELDVTFCVDYKLSSTASGDGSRQIAFYSLGVDIQKGWVFYPVLGVMKPVRLTEVRLSKLQETVLELVTKIESGDRRPNHRYCVRCLYRHACDRKTTQSWGNPWTRS